MLRGPLLFVDLLLVATAGLLAARLYSAWTAEYPLPQVGARATERAEAVPPAPTASRPLLSAYADVAERNLFSPNRTEVAPEPPRTRTTGSGTSTPVPPKPRLYGIVLLSGGKARAYLEDTQRRKVFAYSVGDFVADSRVEQIKSDRVVLRRGNEVFEVLLRDPSKPKPVAPTPPAPTSAAPPPATPTPAPTPRAVPDAPGSPQSPGLTAPTTPRGRLPRPSFPRAAPPDPGSTPDEDQPS